jgi:hypothetical protein
VDEAWMTRTTRPVSRRAVLRGGAAAAAVVAAGPVLAACQSAPSRDLWRQSFTTPVSGDVQVVDLGGWCWFTESRTLITPSGRLFVGTVAAGSGTSRDGSIELTEVDVSNGLRRSSDRRRTLVGRATYPVGSHRVDDHHNPGLGLLSDGAVLAMWSAHDTEAVLRWARQPGPNGPPDGSHDPPFLVPAPIERPDSEILPGRGVSYGSVHPLGGGLVVVAYRGEGFTWNLLRSTDDARTWEAMGTLVVPPVWGERPYVKLAVDGRRLWFATTEGHPRTVQPSNVRVGVIDPLTGAVTAPSGAPLGQVGPGVPVQSVPLAYRCPASADAWISEIRVIAGRPVVSVSLRGPRVDDAAGAWSHDHLRVMRAADGTWVRELVAHGGGELGGNLQEPDYTGLAALDPSTHNRIVVATNVHPRTGVPLRSRADGRVHFELWQMDRRSDGAWLPTALTANSAADNIRPHIAVRGHTKIVSWMRGTYRSPHGFRTAIVARQAG